MREDERRWEEEREIGSEEKMRTRTKKKQEKENKREKRKIIKISEESLTEAGSGINGSCKSEIWIKISPTPLFVSGALNGNQNSPFRSFWIWGYVRIKTPKRSSTEKERVSRRKKEEKGRRRKLNKEEEKKWRKTENKNNFLHSFFFSFLF